MKIYQTITGIILSFTFLAGCAETVSEYVSFDSYQNYKNTVDAGECVAKNGSCRRPADLQTDVYKSFFEGTKVSNPDNSTQGYFGKIDAPEGKSCFHYGKDIYGNDIYGGDIDYIAIMSKPGTPLSIDVIPTGGSKLNPVITIYDESGQSLLFSNKSESLKFLSETNTFYVSIEERSNIGSDGTSCHASNIVGGDNYSYGLIVSKDKNYTKEAPLKVTSNSPSTKTIKLKKGEAYYLDVCLDKTKTSLHYSININDLKRPFMTYLEKDTYNWAEQGQRLYEMSNDLYSSGKAEGNIYATHATEGDECNMFHLVFSDYHGDYGYPIEVSFTGAE